MSEILNVIAQVGDTGVVHVRGTVVSDDGSKVSEYCRYRIEHFEGGNCRRGEQVPSLMLLFAELGVDRENEQLITLIEGMGLPEYPWDWKPDA